MRLNVWNLYVGKNSFARGFFIEQNIICHDRSGFFFHESKLLNIKRHWSGMERLLHQSIGLCYIPAKLSTRTQADTRPRFTG